MDNEKTLELYKEMVKDSGNIIHYRDLIKHGEFNNEQPVDTKIWSSKRVATEYGNFYLAPEGFTEKEIIDAEIFTSQIYKNFGFDNTPFYFPVLKGNKLTLMCNDIKNGRNGIAQEVNEKIQLGSGMSRDRIETMCCDQNSYSALVPKFFTEEFMQKKIKMRLLDIALNVSNRDYNQIMYTVTKLGRVVDLAPLTGGISGLNYLRRNNKMRDEPVYQSEFTTKNQTRIQFLKDFVVYKDSFGIFNNIAMREFVTKLSKIDYKKIAQDIKENLNYEINPDYVSYMENSKEMFLEELQEESYKNSAKTDDYNNAFYDIKQRVKQNIGEDCLVK